MTVSRERQHGVVSAIAVTAAGGLGTLASVSGDVRVTAGGANLPVSAAALVGIGANVSALAEPASALFAAITTPASTGSHEVVAKGAGTRIRVLDYAIVVPGTVQARWQGGSAAAYANLTGGMHLFNGVATPFSPAGKFQTAASAALFLNVGAAVSAGGHLTYKLV